MKRIFKVTFYFLFFPLSFTVFTNQEIEKDNECGPPTTKIPLTILPSSAHHTIERLPTGSVESFQVSQMPNINSPSMVISQQQQHKQNHQELNLTKSIEINNIGSGRVGGMGSIVGIGGGIVAASGNYNNSGKTSRCFDFGSSNNSSTEMNLSNNCDNSILRQLQQQQQHHPLQHPQYHLLPGQSVIYGLYQSDDGFGCNMGTINETNEFVGVGGLDILQGVAQGNFKQFN